jgi:hypothetical protein
MRSWLVEVKSTSKVVSEVSVTPDTRVIEWTCTSGSCLVSNSAVSSSRTRSMMSELKLPMTCPALALSPKRATMSDQVWV